MADPTPLDAQALAQRLREAMQEQGLTQTEVAALAGVSRSKVVHELLHGVERPRNPVTLAKLALALGKPWDWLGAAPPEGIPAGPGYRLYAARLARGWTLDELAAASGVNRHTIYNLEHGATGHPRTWADLARALEVPVAALQGA